ncbi:hypothetical protein DL239_11545 [Sedimentitalea sp. CY04]|uniref:Uncharacterized protein n=1 Tax=Parasedimentitalea denitrificans TaxID=2211118 RepID=A0ABX0WAB8_9RHOB|nr:hypothetical protein [Sedimentitalea sp. CY04]
MNPTIGWISDGRLDLKIQADFLCFTATRYVFPKKLVIGGSKACIAPILSENRAGGAVILACVLPVLLLYPSRSGLI